MTNYQIEYLANRLAEVEYATDNLLFAFDNEDSALYQDPKLKPKLTKLLFEGAAVRRKLAELSND